LKQDGFLGFEPEPSQVFERGAGKCGRAAERIDVLDADEKSSASLASQIEIEERRVGMPEMEPAIGARRETEPHHYRAGAPA
jgi:hypothetical protein